MIFKTLLLDILNIFERLSQEHISLFLSLYNKTDTQKIYLTTKEERKHIRALSNSLSELDIQNNRYIARLLVESDIYSINEISPLLESEQYLNIIEIFHRLVLIKKSNQIVSKSVDRASRIVKALKMYIHSDTTETKEKSRVNVTESIKTVLALYKNKLKKGVEIKLFFSDNLPQVLANGDQLHQVWTNLIGNACQAMDYNGILEISAFSNSENVTIEIKDNGSGIPEEIQKNIFNPFFTTKKKGEGSGLGLDIVRRIIENQNGQITFTSIQGKGTTFLVKLPLLA